MSKIQLSKDVKQGFTLIELMLSMSFVAVLLITIAIITVNILAIYQKGITLRTVNAVGRELVDEFTNALNSSPSVDTKSLCGNTSVISYENRDKCRADKANKFIYQDSVVDGKQMNGIFCTGRYSYIWNTEYGRETGNTLKLRYYPNDDSGGYATGFRMIRVDDKTYEVCTAMIDNQYNSILTPNSTINITTIKKLGMPNPIPRPEGAFLESSDVTLELYELVVFPISQDAVSLRTFMTGTFVLATEEGNIDISRGGDYCDVTDGFESGDLNSLSSSFNYCAINKFNFAAHTAGI